MNVNPSWMIHGRVPFRALCVGQECRVKALFIGVRCPLLWFSSSTPKRRFPDPGPSPKLEFRQVEVSDPSTVRRDHRRPLPVFMRVVLVQNSSTGHYLDRVQFKFPSELLTGDFPSYSSGSGPNPPHPLLYSSDRLLCKCMHMYVYLGGCLCPWGFGVRSVSFVTSLILAEEVPNPSLVIKPLSVWTVPSGT